MDLPHFRQILNVNIHAACGIVCDLLPCVRFTIRDVHTTEFQLNIYFLRLSRSYNYIDEINHSTISTQVRARVMYALTRSSGEGLFLSLYGPRICIMFDVVWRKWEEYVRVSILYSALYALVSNAYLARSDSLQSSTSDCSGVQCDSGLSSAFFAVSMANVAGVPSSRRRRVRSVSARRTSKCRWCVRETARFLFKIRTCK